MDSQKLRIGSRMSPLALAQTEEVLSYLRLGFNGIEFVVVPISTGGDRNKNTPIDRIGRGAFSKDIESALLDGKIDIAVHSAKDLANRLPSGLFIAATVSREDPRDVLINRWGLKFSEMPTGARIGTGSPRRMALIKSLRADIEVVPIRGNVGTRLGKINGSEYDGVVLAAAGLARLGKTDAIHDFFPCETFIPDVGQGILAIESRISDRDISLKLKEIDHCPTSLALKAERSFLEELGGGCTVPVAAYAMVDKDELILRSMAAVPDGSRIFRVDMSCSMDDPVNAGKELAVRLRESGAREIF